MFTLLLRIYICFSRSFMLSSAGFTCVAFVAGALAWWAPTFLQLGFTLHPNGHNVDPDEYVFILFFIYLK